ncbi:Signal transduction histidine kinase [Micromonospora narathiwatensis]|uniref:histidine kinase n=1 Tax=Micromonospora narathiwatensis TaxID=299146 RepID=A0A1A8ZP94_9ACTN|nr:Signal transduction histidine kinase [Micromonospora narathiwatensis]
MTYPGGRHRPAPADTVRGVDRSRRLGRRQLIALDGLAAIGYLLLFASSAVVRADVPAWLSMPLMAAVGAPVAVRRRWPGPVFLVVFAASVAAAAAGVLADPFVAAAFALYPLACDGRRAWVPAPVAGTVAAVVLVGGSVAGTPYQSWHRLGVVVLGAGLLAGAWTVGRVVRARRADAARSAAELAGRAVAEERLRIARELHDVVAHSMSLIAVKAGTANHVLAVRPDEAQNALRVIESTSRGALAEMRHLLGVLRSDADGAALAPTPGLAGLPTLAERAEQAGVPVELDVRDVDELPEGVALSVYRIVQEALTNVVRHAGPARCRVSVAAGRGEVRVEVTDDGPGSRVPSPDRPAGHGLIGMRERVLMYGGSFHAGPRPEGGFSVSARLPCEP